jgi:DDE superfamily endonuclease
MPHGVQCTAVSPIGVKNGHGTYSEVCTEAYAIHKLRAWTVLNRVLNSSSEPQSSTTYRSFVQRYRECKRNAGVQQSIDFNPHPRPWHVRQTHHSLHHVVAHAPWRDENILEAVRRYALPAMQKQGPIEAWIVDDTGLVKKGTHSVGVTRQYCGQVGKQENCRVAVSLSVSTREVSLPIAWRLYLPEVWVHDKKRRKATGIPREISFQTKPEIALQQIRTAWTERSPPLRY